MPSRPPRPGGPGRSCSRCRRTCRRTTSRRRTRNRTRRCRLTRARTTSRACGSCSPARSGRSRSWAAAAGRSRRRTDFLAFAEANELPVGASFRRQDYIDNASRVYAGHVGIGPDPKLAARVRDADLLLVVGARLGECDDQRLHARRARPAAPDARPRPRRRGGARPRVPAGARDRVRLAPVRRRGAGARAGRLVGLARGDRAGARRPPREPAALGRPRGPADGRGDGVAARAAAGRRDPHERRRQLLGLGAPLLRVPPLRDAARADERRDGLRRACRGRRRSCSTRIASSCASPATATS